MFTPFPKIEQFRNVISKVERLYTKAPTIRFTGTVKLHGTNAGIGWDLTDNSDLHIQSRRQTISVDGDNAGFARFVNDHDTDIKRMMSDVANKYPINDGEIALFIYGEWCGKGIQKGVAIARLDPRYIVFSAAYRNADGISRWLPAAALDSFNGQDNSRIYSIYQFPTWTQDISFNKQDLYKIQDQLTSLSNEVGRLCPVGKYFNVDGGGEGIVWSAQVTCPKDSKLHHLMFKVKDERHMVSKSSPAAIDIAKISNIEKFIQYAVTENRLEQGYDEIFTKTGKEPVIKNMGLFVKWVHNDILKEESDTIATNGIEPKHLGKYISEAATSWFRRRTYNI